MDPEALKLRTMNEQEGMNAAVIECEMAEDGVIR